MAMIVGDRTIQRNLIKRRQRLGLDRFDEVWDGVYFVAPAVDTEHGLLDIDLGFLLRSATLHLVGCRVSGPCSITDLTDKWTKNFRVPDFAVFLATNTAVNRGSHWLGGPDFVVEILSPGDRAREKFDFYAKVGVREVLLIDRKPWALELYRVDNGTMNLVAKVTADRPVVATSAVLPLSFRLLPAEPRPIIEATQTQDGRTWTA